MFFMQIKDLLNKGLMYGFIYGCLTRVSSIVWYKKTKDLNKVIHINYLGD